MSNILSPYIDANLMTSVQDFLRFKRLIYANKAHHGFAFSLLRY